MRKFRITALAVAAASTVLVAGAATAAVGTGSHGSSGPLLRHVAPHQVTVAHEKLKDSVVVNGYSGASLPGGFVAIDSGESINCAVGCTIEADMSVQAVDNTGGGNDWAICLYIVDLGAYANCPFYGVLDSAFYENGTQIESINALPAGTHTVQTQVYTTGAATAYNYALTYHSYKP